ncbi:hypothetical protein U1Q18_049620 [Sarracenia purpurea var. burkii]
MMKSFAIILIIAFCVQCILSNENPDEGKRNQRKGGRIVTKSPLTSKDLSRQIKAQTRQPAPTIEKPLNVIKGENGTIKVDGKIVCENDEFKKGIVDLDIQNGSIRINNKLIFEAKPTGYGSRWNGGKRFSSVTSFVIETFNHDPAYDGVLKRGMIKYTDDQGRSYRTGL